MVVIGNDGVIGKRLLVPGTLTDCSPVRWWTSGVLLARCAGSSASQLWRVPLDGGAPSAVTAVNTGQEDSGFGPDLGDTNAWQLPSGTFLQSEGGCGSMFLSRLTPDLRTTKVTVPGVDPDNSVLVSGVSADKLVLRATVGCGSGISALTYDPAANTTSVLLGPPVNGGGVQNAILYGRKGS
jgi:TolB protein